MAEHVTCCPHCNTSFKITDEHLAIAKGAVRCGSCLEVFNALEHIVGNQPAKSAHITSPQNDDPEDDVLISDDMDDDGLSLGELSSEFQTEIAEEGQADSLFDRKKKAKTPKHKDESDESWAKKLLGDDPDADDTEESNDPLDIDSEPDTTTHESTEAEDTFTENKDEESEIFESFSATDELDQSFDQGEGAAFDNTQDTPQEENTDLYLPEDSFSASKHELLSAIATAPVEMDTAPSSYPLWRSIAWSTLALLALLSLSIQLAWYNRDSLSLSPSYRPSYEGFCNLFGCDLPPITQLDKIKISNVVVRPHPDFDDALIVDCILLNTARYPQKFSDVQVTFSTIDNTVAAARRFKPSEYLKGELAGRTQMEPNKPVHLNFELVDPGAEAVNYAIQLVP